MRTVGYVVGGLLAVIALAAAGLAGGQAQELDGTYVLSPHGDQRAVVERAITEAVASLPDATRRPLQARMIELTRPARLLRLEHRGDQWTLQVGTRPAVSSPDDGSARMLARGWRLRQQLLDGQLVQRFSKEGFVHDKRHQLDPSGQRLRVRGAISGGGLPQPVSYQLTYTRAQQ